MMYSEVNDMTGFRGTTICAVRRAGKTAVVCYELGGCPLGEAPQLSGGDISLFIGSEGGFEQGEIDKLLANGATAVTLGSRILRAETAPLAALSIIMYITGNMSGGEHRPEPRGGDWKSE